MREAKSAAKVALLVQAHSSEIHILAGFEENWVEFSLIQAFHWRVYLPSPLA